jgi:hypothetical protein
MRNYRLLMLVLTGLVLSVTSPATAADVVRDSWSNRIEIQHDVNICGDLATFTFSSTGHVITTDTGSGFHFEFVDVDMYTVDFDDPSMGVWEGRATETSTFNATPGDVITLHVGNNNIEGDVRIRELKTLVISPDGQIRVDTEVFDVVGC